MSRKIKNPAVKEPLISDMSGDPFYIFKDALSSQVQALTLKHEQWSDLLNNTNTATNPDFQPLHNGLNRDLQACQVALDDLRGTVVMVENRRDDFNHIDEIELGSRRSFVDDMTFSINKIKSNIQNQKTIKKMERDQRDMLTGRQAKEKEINDKRNAPMGGGDAWNNHRQTQELAFKEQDVILDSMQDSVVRLGEMSNAINYEIKDQGRLLNDMDNDLEQTKSQMDMLTGKVGKLLKTTNNCQIYTVMGLSLTLIILVVLVVFV